MHRSNIHDEAVLDALNDLNAWRHRHGPDTPLRIRLCARAASSVLLLALSPAYRAFWRELQAERRQVAARTPHAA
jgi:hypothetical protein